MAKGNCPVTIGEDAILRRAEELDALDAILPFDRRDQLAALLTDEEVATLKHLAENTLRALATAPEVRRPSPLGSGQARRGRGPRYAGRRRGGTACRTPAPVPRTARAGHGPTTADLLVDPDALARFDRRLRRTVARIRLRLAVRASARPRQRKSKKAVTVDILAKLLQACAGDRLVDLRDHALLLTAFASGGRRRSEVAALRVEHLTDEEPVRADPPTRPPLPSPALSVDPPRPHQDDDRR